MPNSYMLVIGMNMDDTVGKYWVRKGHFYGSVLPGQNACLLKNCPQNACFDRKIKKSFLNLNSSNVSIYLPKHKCPVLVWWHLLEE